MSQATFKFISEAVGGSQFSVVSFTAHEAISTLYEYQIEVKAPLSAALSLDDVLDSSARFITELDGKDYPVYGILSNFEELQTVQEYVHYRAVLVPRLWALSTYKTNEIYTQEKTLDLIIQTVLDSANKKGADIEYDLKWLGNHLLSRDYVCQFGESDFDFISRLMENEGVFYYFDQSGSSAEKIIFINDMNYETIHRPALVFDVTPSTSQQYDCIDAWSCRKQRLASGVTVRDFNPEHPSLDIAYSSDVDQMGRGTDYIYGGNIQDKEEATYLSTIRAEEMRCKKTRYYGEGSVTRLQAGYLFEIDHHPNQAYNNIEYLVLEVNHEGQHLDMHITSGSAKVLPQYRNSFVAIEASEQFRPVRVTPKPRFYGTMTAFIYAESGDAKPEVDEFGRYRVHLPFDRADGTKDSDDPDRKASAWIRMAQPYVGQNQGMYFPLTNGTEVLLTFINGDPDQPIISSALPNASQPSLMQSKPAWSSIVTNLVKSEITSNTHNISSNIARIEELEGPPQVIPTGANAHFINDNSVTLSKNMLPPWTAEELTQADNSPSYDESLIKFKYYDKDFNARNMTETDLDNVSTDRCAGDNYIYANARTFVYPQHERVYFIGSFHEDFHVKDDFSNASNSWTGRKEVFNLPAPGTDFPPGTNGESSDSEVNPSGVRGVAEAKFWGDQMNYAWGRSFNWAGGPVLLDDDGENGSFAEYNYGNGYTENLLIATGGTSEDLPAANKLHADDYTGFGEFQNKGLASASIEKTWGSVYSYQNGFSLDIKEGNSYERVYGDKNEEVHGHSVSHVYGSSHSTQEGAVSEMFLGAKNEFAWSYTNSITGGAATEVYGGFKGEFNLAGTLGIFVGVQTELALSANFGVHIGFEIGYQAAGFLKRTDGVGIDWVSAKIGGNDVDIDSVKLRLNDAISHIGSIHLAVTMADIEIH